MLGLSLLSDLLRLVNHPVPAWSQAAPSVYRTSPSPEPRHGDLVSPLPSPLTPCLCTSLRDQPAPPLTCSLSVRRESGALSSDSALSGTADLLNGNTSSEQQRRANRDSAYWDDGLDTLAARAALETVGESMDLVQYGRQEWRGTTPRATTMRQVRRTGQEVRTGEKEGRRLMGRLSREGPAARRHLVDEPTTIFCDGYDGSMAGMGYACDSALCPQFVHLYGPCFFTEHFLRLFRQQFLRRVASTYCDKRLW